MPKEALVKSDLDTGVALYQDEHVVVLNDAHYARLQQELETYNPALAHQSMYLASEAGAKDAVNAGLKVILQTIGMAFSKKIIDATFEMANIRGLGRFMVEPGFDYVAGAGQVRVTNSFIARHYAKGDKPVCFSVAGVIAGGSESLHGGPYYCEETTCAAQGQLACLFDVKPVDAQTRNALVRTIR